MIDCFGNELDFVPGGGLIVVIPDHACRSRPDDACRIGTRSWTVLFDDREVGLMLFSTRERLVEASDESGVWLLPAGFSVLIDRSRGGRLVPPFTSWPGRYPTYAGSTFRMAVRAIGAELDTNDREQRAVSRRAVSR